MVCANGYRVECKRRKDQLLWLGFAGYVANNILGNFKISSECFGGLQGTQGFVIQTKLFQLGVLMALKSLGLSLLGATSVVEQNSLCENTSVYACVSGR